METQLTVGRRAGAAALTRFWAGIGALFATLVAAALLTVAVGPAALTSWTATVVGSDSMAPKLRTGDVVVLEPAGAKPLGRPSVILIDQGDEEPPLLHRVIDYDPLLGYTTKGDANPSPDSAHATHEDVLGVGRILVPVVGLPVVWLGEGNFLPLLGVTGAAVIVVRLARYGWDPRYDPWAGARPTPNRVSRSRAVPTSAGGAIVLLAFAVAVNGPPIPALATFTASTQTAGNRLASDTLKPPAGTLSLICTPGATPRIIANHTATGTFSLTLKAPTTVREGDLLVAHIVGTSPGGGQSGNPFTHVATAVPSSMGSVVYQHRAGSGDAGKSFTWSINNGIGTLLVIRDGALVVPSSTGSAVTSRTEIDAPSIAGRRGSMLLALFSTLTEGAVFSTPAGMTQVPIGDGHRLFSSSAATQILTADGPTGPRTSTAPSANVMAAHSLMIHPSSTAKASVELAWGTSPSPSADGYAIWRDGAHVATVTPRTTLTWRDNDPGTAAHTYEVRAYDGNWLSAPVSKSNTAGPTC